MPYAAPYYYAPPPQKARTPQGVKWTLIAFTIYLGYLVVSSLIAIVVAQTIQNLTPSNLGQSLTSLLLLLLVGLVFVVFGILCLVFYFLGFGYLYGGRNEFGPAHARNVKMAMYFLVAALSTWPVGIVLGFILGSMTYTFTGTTIQFNPGAFYAASAVGAVVGVVVAALLAVVFVLSIRGLVQPRYQNPLYVAAAIGTATPGIVGAFTLLQLARYIALLQAASSSPFGPPSFDPGLGLPAFVGGILGLVTFLLYIVVYRDVAHRLRTGDLKPVLPPPMPTSWMPGPVVPYPTPSHPGPPSPVAAPAVPPAEPGQTPPP